MEDISGMIQLFQIPVHLFISTTPLVEYASAAIGIPNIPSYVPGRPFIQLKFASLKINQ